MTQLDYRYMENTSDKSCLFTLCGVALPFMLVETSDLVSVTELGRSLNRYVNEAAESGRRIIILNSNTPTAALVSITDLERLNTLDAAPAVAVATTPVEPPTQNDAAERPGFAAIGRDADGAAVYWSLTDHHFAAARPGGGLGLLFSAAIAGAVPDPVVPTTFLVASAGPHVSLRHQRIHPDIPIALECDLRQRSNRQRLVEIVDAEIAWRSELLRQYRVDNVTELRQVMAESPHLEATRLANLVIVLADSAGVIDCDDDVFDPLPVVQHGASLGVYLWLGCSDCADITRRPSAHDLVSRIPTRVVIGSVDTATQSRALLSSDVGTRPVPADSGWIRTDPGEAPMRFAVIAPTHGPGGVVTSTSWPPSSGGEYIARPPLLSQPVALGDIPAVPLDPNESGLTIPIGVTSPPWEALTVRLDDANPHTSIVGGPGSGLTTALKTLIAAAAMRYTPQQCAFVLIDAGGGHLKDMAGRANVAGYTRADDADGVERMLGEARRIIEIRQLEFARRAVASFDDYNISRMGSPIWADRYDRLIVVIDGLDQLVRTDDAPVRELLDHADVFGVHVIATTRSEVTISKLGRGLKTQLWLGGADDVDILRSRALRQLGRKIPSEQPGRGVDLHESRLARIAIPYPGRYSPDLGTSDHAAGVDLLERCAARYPIDKVTVTPTRIDPDDFWRQVGAPRATHPFLDPIALSESRLPLGVAIDTGQVVDLPAHRSPHLVVVGVTGSGRSSTLRALSEAIRRSYAPHVSDDRCAASVVIIDERGDLDDVRRRLADEQYLLPAGPGPKDAFGLPAGPEPKDALEAVAALIAQRAVPREAPAAAEGEGALNRTQASPQVFILIDAPELRDQEWLAAATKLVESGRNAGVHVYLTTDANNFVANRQTKPLLRALASAPTLLLRGPRSEGTIWPGSGIRFAARRPPGRGQLVVDPTDTLDSRTIQLPCYPVHSNN